MPVATDDNVLIVGGKRTGKTYLLRSMIAECMSSKRSVVVLDCCDEYRLPSEVLVPGDAVVSARLSRAVLSAPWPLRVRVLVRHADGAVLDGVSRVLHHLRDVTVVVDEVHAYCKSSLTAPREFESFIRMDTGANHKGSNVLMASQLPDVPVSIRCAVNRVAVLRMAPEHLRRMYARGLIDYIPEYLTAEAPYPRGYRGQVVWI